jgi:hypothetical protein
MRIATGVIVVVVRKYVKSPIASIAKRKSVTCPQSARTSFLRYRSPNTLHIPTTAPTAPTVVAAHTPTGNAKPPPLKGTYAFVGLALASAEPPVPPPVRFAPFGCSRQYTSPAKQRRRNGRTPIGRELSAKAQSEAVQRHFPATGSQKGVEQFVGTVSILNSAKAIGDE